MGDGGDGCVEDGLGGRPGLGVAGLVDRQDEVSDGGALPGEVGDRLAEFGGEGFDVGAVVGVDVGGKLEEERDEGAVELGGQERPGGVGGGRGFMLASW